MDSPPKRMTRARAAARAGSNTTKTTRIVTAAARARSLSTATASTKSTSAKRKARDVEKNDLDEEAAGINTRRAVRARPGNRDETAICGTTSVESISRESRSRAAGRTKEVVPEDGHALAVTRTRGRVRNPASQDGTNPTRAVSKTDKKTTQARVVDSTVSKAARDDSKSVTRRTGRIQRPGKENMSLGSKAEETSADNARQGLRGRPTRRAARPVTADRRQRPLSPRKVTQMPVSRDMEGSDDELQGGDGLRMTAKSPKRISMGRLSKEEKKSEDTCADPEDDGYRDAAKLTAGPGPAALGSSPRRAPPSPARETLKSPAKRVGGLQLPGLNLQSRILSVAEQDTHSLPDHSNALLQSPAKRPPSPIKGLNNFPTKTFGGTLQEQTLTKGCSMLQSPAKRAMPGALSLMQHGARASAPLAESPEMQPIMAVALPVSSSGRPSDLLLAEELDDPMQNSMADNPFDEPIEGLCFSKKMLATPSGQTDWDFVEQGANESVEDSESVWKANATLSGTDDCGAPEVTSEEGRSTCQGEAPAVVAQEADHDEFMNLQDIMTEMEETGEVLALTDKSDAVSDKMQYALDLKTQDGVVDSSGDSKLDEESEDEASRGDTISVMHEKKGRRTSHPGDGIYPTQRPSRRSTMGLQLSAEQCGSWSATSPVSLQTSSTSGSVKDSNSTFPKANSHTPLDAFGMDTSPVRSTFFEDEIMVHADSTLSKELGMSRPGEYEGDGMEDIAMLDEDNDVAVAHEAKAMSPMPQQEAEEAGDDSVCEETLSEASQEYADENELPVDPVLASSTMAQMVTPARPPLRTAFFTTTKVPLKPADDSEPSPSPLKKRSFSAGRVSYRSAGSLSLPRSATAISYSPTRDSRRSSVRAGDMFSTPTKGEEQPSADTPGHQLGRDVDAALLRGCVVLVDVHTTEGADASGIFVELLTQMGAKCVKTWHWNPSASGNGDSSSSSKVGITHVVFKDGGKRTMEKVREAGGVVHCVGVSWVLDCERENRWLDEAPYYLDTSLVPRGGARRRKSMEPRAITNVNGTIVPGNKTLEPLSTPKNRRESTLWMHTPPEQGDDHDEEDLEWSCALLTPVPKTPAPEAVARYASELAVTPSPSSEEDPDSQSPTRQSLLTRTCPPKEGRYQDLGQGILGRDKDEQVIVRLMAARRKSLQFAPKVGSPLARTWN
ncbi:hypothetical protein E4U42_000599 [Claviceps africana]|uniref:BRCT domain-containing protein n=1 Tax=Claviceps africana TaxID=83212 RepID=A0A8K0NKP8_9HYPO|nr:hypothetical protein E4U42_000599 [Claviceps africana]